MDIFNCWTGYSRCRKAIGQLSCCCLDQICSITYNCFLVVADLWTSDSESSGSDFPTLKYSFYVFDGIALGGFDRL
uniref:Uncharacterized protein n=1 Tax=Ciona intestinalis TaxID=7719 RepID=H2XLB8_CIOIN